MSTRLTLSQRAPTQNTSRSDETGTCATCRNGMQPMTTDQVPLLASEPDRKPELSQWFTPPDLSKRIVEWAFKNQVMPVRVYVLEPSCGRGALIVPMKNVGREVHVTGFDIDPENIAACKTKEFYGIASVGFAQCDFLKVTKMDRHDLAIMNPPFEGGQTERHIMHALKFADRVVCHCPLTTLAGKARRESMWSKVQLHRLAICSARPKYGENGGKTDMCTIDVTIRDHRESRDATDVEWW